MRFPAVHRRTVAAAVVVPGGPARSRLAPGIPGEGPAGRAPTVRGYAVKELPHGGRLPQGAKPPIRGTRQDTSGNGPRMPGGHAPPHWPAIMIA